MTTAPPSVPAKVEPVRHGPEGLPRHTLAWAAIDWASRYLLQPDRPVAGQPWRFTDEQMRFLAWWYAVDDAGAFLYTYGVLRRLKGWGKDPLAAVMAAIELCGPCRFGGWRNGEPIAVPQPSAWVQIAAVSKEQTRNTMTLFPGLFSKQAIREYGIDIGKEILYALGGRNQLQAVTSSPKTIEGARSTFVVMNETHHWLVSNDGEEMAQAIRRNSAKLGGRPLAITNAHRIGEGSVAEADWEKYEKAGDSGTILYDSIEAPPETDLEDDDSLRAGLMAARGDSVWVPIERLMIDVRDDRDPEPLRRRFYLNQLRKEVSTWIAAHLWAAAEREETVAAGTLITLGFDGARFRDATALVGTVVATGYQFLIGLWQRPEDAAEWEVPEEEVKAAVTATFEKFRVWRFYCDPYWWEETIAGWRGKWGEDRVALFHTNRQMQRMTRTLKAYETAVRTGELTHEPGQAFAEHIANAVKQDVNLRDEDGERLYLIRKEAKNSPRKMDAAMAAVLSWAARVDALAAGAGGEGEQWPTFGAV
jgi:hypothetical protein